jgi:hypothetical protein
MNKFLIKRILTELLFNTKLCESANQQNIVEFFYENLLLEKLLVGEPVSVPELRKILRNKILNFEFIKLDGEVRPAKGTTMMKYIPTPDHPKGIRPSSPKVATFFDLEKKAWRSVSQRSKEIVLKYSFGEKGKKRPVFIVKDKDKEPEEVEKDDTVSTTGEPEFSDPSSTGADDYSYVSPTVDDVDKEDEFEEPVSEPEEKGFDTDKEIDDFLDIEKSDTNIEDVKPVSKPQVDVVTNEPTGPKYGWKIKQQHKPDHKPQVNPIVRPQITKAIEKPMPVKDETEVILPQEVRTQSPYVKPSLPTKEPPLEIDPEEDEF